MRFIHLSDLHIGKRVNDFPMYEDQEYVLKQVIDVIKNNNIDGVIIAGDIYDKAVAPAEAVALYDRFITSLSHLDIPVFIISGNHDNAQRLSFASDILKKSDIYIASVFEGKLEKVTMHDKYGEINIYMLPFIRPATVKRYMVEDVSKVNNEKTDKAITDNIMNYDEKKISEDENDIADNIINKQKADTAQEDKTIFTYTDAVKWVIDNTDIDRSKRNIIIAHQFVTGAVTCDSEELSVGGLDNVEASVFNAFDYVALGHIHGPQTVSRDTIRYCGSLLKYSFSEINHNKSITIADIKGKNPDGGCDIEISTFPARPLHNMRHIKGSYSEITDRSSYINTCLTDYMYITLTDEEDIFDAIGKLRSIYPNIMKLDYDNTRTRNQSYVLCDNNAIYKSPVEITDDFYEIQNGQAMSEEQRGYLSDTARQIWEENL